MKKIASLMAISFAFAVAGCNTVAGAGKDVQRGGAAVEKKAEDVKKK